MTMEYFLIEMRLNDTVHDESHRALFLLAYFVQQFPFTIGDKRHNAIAARCAGGCRWSSSSRPRM